MDLEKAIEVLRDLTQPGNHGVFPQTIEIYCDDYGGEEIMQAVVKVVDYLWEHDIDGEVTVKPKSPTSDV